jgi:glycerol kinase
MGAAFLAGLAEGVWETLDTLETSWGLDRRFEPAFEQSQRGAAREQWHLAVDRARGQFSPRA